MIQTATLFNAHKPALFDDVTTKSIITATRVNLAQRLGGLPIFLLEN